MPNLVDLKPTLPVISKKRAEALPQTSPPLCLLCLTRNADFTQTTGFILSVRPLTFAWGPLRVGPCDFARVTGLPKRCRLDNRSKPRVRSSFAWRLTHQDDRQNDPPEASAHVHDPVDFVLTCHCLDGFRAGLSWGEEGPPDDISKSSRFRRPVALVLSPDGTWLFSANRRSGSLSVVDPGSGRVVSERDLGRGLSDLAVLPDGRLVAVDRDGDALLVLDSSGGSVEATLTVATDPVSVMVAPDGSSCVVASTASRKLSVIRLGSGEGLAQRSPG